MIVNVSAKAQEASDVIVVVLKVRETKGLLTIICDSSCNFATADCKEVTAKSRESYSQYIAKF